MPDDQAAARSRHAGAVRTGRALPPEAVEALRTAFAGEVAVRLPRLLQLLHQPPGPDALRDAHSLASSAVVVGEVEAARTARALEADLLAGAPDPAWTRTLVSELAGRLAGRPPA